MEKTVRVTRSFLPPMEEYVEMLKPIWDSAWLTNMGDYHERLKERLKEYLNVEGIELFTNGHLALEMALQAFELEGEVITTPFTFASTTHAIVRNGLTPVFCDIDPEDYTIDTDRIEEQITERTCAIVPVHVYGNICQVDKIEKIAKKHGLKVIYDAAHAFGETVDGRGIGTFGDASMFSFHATKVYHTIEGGAVTFREKWLADRLYKLKNFGIMGEESVEFVGGNGKMNEFQAAMGLCNLKYTEQVIARRKELTERYREHLQGIKGLKLCPEKEGVKSNYAYMPVVFEGNGFQRDEVAEQLKNHGIYPRKYFYPCVNAYQCYQGTYDPKDTPVADRISRQVLTLPLYPDLEMEEVDRICRIILGECRKA